MTQSVPGLVPTVPTPPTLDTLEIRLATTMTGGVSLAVWMGGVAREIDLLTQASNARRGATGQSPAPPVSQAHAERNLYSRLLELLDVVVDVDILSGTSAGGINAALLAYARTRGGDLSPLRNIWLDLGALLDLLRNPTDTDIPSVLYGDRWMLKGLDDKIPELGSANPPGKPHSTTLYITTTLLTGEASRFTDGMGTLVQDTDRRGVFTFTETDLKEDRTKSALALAARSTASFPGAFEPSFVPFDTPTKAAGDVPERPAMGQYANITRSHWVADGGLLDNQPLDLLLQRIFDRPASRPVRRVLLYVVPTSGSAPDLTTAAPTDELDHPYGLLDGLLKDLTAATSQSISADLQAIVAHNKHMNARSDLRLQLVELAGRLQGVDLLTPSLLSAYCAQAADREAQQLIMAMFKLLTTWPAQPAAGSVGVPKNWRPQLTPGGDGERLCTAAAMNTLTARWCSDTAELPSSSEDYARFGVGAYDNAKSLVLTVIRLAYDSAHDDASKQKVAELIRPLHEAAGTRTRPDAASLAQRACTDAVTTKQGSLSAASAALASLWADQTVIEASAWDKLSGLLTGARDVLTQIADAAGNEALTAYLGYLGLKQDPLASAEDVARKLFNLAVTEQTFLPSEDDLYQPVELVQLSADTRSLLTPSNATAASKLTGLQFHHFGAFYKKSWRANDWMWGRLDASGWLVHALLDPRRLKSRAETLPPGSRAGWVMERLVGFGPTELPPGDDAQAPLPTAASVRAELAFLDDDTVQIPQGLPRTSMWLASAFQRLIAHEELPLLADTVLGTAGADEVDRSPAASRTWASKVRAPGADLDALLAACPIPRETFGTDIGTPLMVHTISKAAATTTGAVASVGQIPGPVRPAITTAQTLALGGYRVTRAVGGVPRYLILIGLGLLVLGVGLATQSSDLFGIAGLSLAALGAYLLTFGAWQFSSRLLAALAAVTVIGAIASLAAGSVRRWLFDTSPDHPGYVTRELNWLGSTWWHPLLVVAIALIAASVIVAICSGVGGRRKVRG